MKTVVLVANWKTLGLEVLASSENEAEEYGKNDSYHLPASCRTQSAGCTFHADRPMEDQSELTSGLLSTLKLCMLRKCLAYVARDGL